MSLKVEVFSSPGCAKCGQAKEVLRKLALELGGDALEWREVNILENVDYAVDLGVLTTPAIAIDGEIVFAGLPSAKRLRETLEQRLDNGAAA